MPVLTAIATVPPKLRPGIAPGGTVAMAAIRPARPRRSADERAVAVGEAEEGGGRVRAERERDVLEGDLGDGGAVLGPALDREVAGERLAGDRERDAGAGDAEVGAGGEGQGLGRVGGVRDGRRGRRRVDEDLEGGVERHAGQPRGDPPADGGDHAGGGEADVAGAVRELERGRRTRVRAFARAERERDVGGGDPQAGRVATEGEVARQGLAEDLQLQAGGADRREGGARGEHLGGQERERRASRRCPGC